MTKRNINWALTLCAIGGTVALIGELMGATDKQRGDTISEKYRDLPDWIKHLISWMLGAVCAHLWQWQIGPSIEVKDSNVEIHSDEEHA